MMGQMFTEPCVSNASSGQALLQRLQVDVSASPVIIRSNKWGEFFKPLSRLPEQAVQSNLVYQPREAFLVSISISARRINADRYP